jgi:hypothetical protein
MFSEQETYRQPCTSVGPVFVYQVQSPSTILTPLTTVFNSSNLLFSPSKIHGGPFTFELGACSPFANFSFNIR